MYRMCSSQLRRAARQLVVAALVAVALGVSTASGSATVQAARPVGSATGEGGSSRILGAGAPSAIPGSYIVKLKDSTTVRAVGMAARARALSDGHHGTLGHLWELSLHGFSVAMSEADALQLADEPDVAYVEQAQRYTVSGVQVQANPPNWGLDRIDQRGLLLDNSYHYDASAGAGAHAYIVDTGVRVSHTDFGGRATNGRDTVNNDDIAEDCDGHGTNVAGIVGSTTYGVAKKVQLVAVKVFGCTTDASGKTVAISTATSIQDGLDWVRHHVIKPAVINFSIGNECKDAAGNTTDCPSSVQSIIDQLNGAVTDGITVVVSAGNSDIDACRDVYALPTMIVVGATDNTDGRWVTDATHASNYGSCVDIWAPGKDIVSTGKSSDTGTSIASGTSQAAPHVAGMVALLLGTSDFRDASPARIKSQLLATATIGALTNLGAGSPNRLLYVAPLVPTGGSSVALARNRDGRLELFGVNNDGFMFHRAQDPTVLTSWGGWMQSQSAGWVSLAAEPFPDGSGGSDVIHLVGLTNTDTIWHRRQSTANASTYLGWRHLDGLLISVAMASRPDGRQVMVGANARGDIFVRTQKGLGSNDWDPWALLPTIHAMGAVAAVTTGDGRVTVVTVDSLGNAWYTAQTQVNTDNWSPFTALDGGLTLRAVALATNQDGTLELVATDSTGQVVRRVQTSDGSWSAWSNLPATPATPVPMRQIAAETNMNNLVTVVGVDQNGHIWQSTQTAANSGSYSTWTQIDGLLRS